MASTPDGRRLTDVYRRAQARLGQETVEMVRATWSQLDPYDLDGTFRRWVGLAGQVVEAQRARSAILGSRYYLALRALEAPTAEALQPVLATALDLQAFGTSMLVTGPASVRAARARGVSTTSAMATAETRASAAALRHALNGGRDTINRTITADRSALGYARAASGDACGFCAMLASRGPVYTETSVDFPTHDGCSCVGEPVWRRLSESAWPAGSSRYRDLWEETTAGFSGDDAVNAFRQAIGH